MDTSSVHPGIILKLHYFQIDVHLEIIVCLVVLVFSFGSVCLGKNALLEMIVIFFSCVVSEIIVALEYAVFLGNVAVSEITVVSGNSANLMNVAVSENIVNGKNVVLGK